MRVQLIAIACCVILGVLIPRGNAAELPSAPPREITYHRDVAPILHRHCAVCHREGEVAPFPLLAYEDAAKRADWIVENITNRRMPPWKAEHGFGEFVGERRLTDQQINTIAAWAKVGAPQGNPADAQSPPQFPDGWGLGEPDLILDAPHEVCVPASGPDVFHHFVIDAGQAAGREISAVEFRPGNPRAVHHAVILLDTSGLARARDAATSAPGYETAGAPGVSLAGILTVWAPGVTARRLPEEVAIKAPDKGDIVVQLHLHPSGKEERDRSRIGIYFAKQPASRHIMNRPFLFGPVTLDIPAGASDYSAVAEVKLPVDIWLTAVLPHMHLLGRKFEATATLPSGTVQPLIRIGDWDFNWQDQYVYKTPVHLPAGSIVRVQGVYDNSADNPANPRTPPARVVFGEETHEEMCLAIFQAIAAGPEDSDLLRDAVAKNIAEQLRDPAVAPDVVQNVVARLRDLAQAEMQQLIRRRIEGLFGQAKD